MDGQKMPFLPEETLRTQRVELYLNDLKDRLKMLKLQHNEVIQNSVNIIRELDEVSSNLLVVQDPKADKGNIKKLIQEFETVKQISTSKSPVNVAKVDIRKILENFEKLNESHVLKESLVLFKRAKETFEKIDTFFNKPDHVKDIGSIASVKNKISAFNSKTDESRANESQYSSCCSSNMSIETFHSLQDFKPQKSSHSMEIGYEGDIDSEYDLLALKKKKSKYQPPDL